MKAVVAQEREVVVAEHRVAAVPYAAAVMTQVVEVRMGAGVRVGDQSDDAQGVLHLKEGVANVAVVDQAGVAVVGVRVAEVEDARPDWKSVPCRTLQEGVHRGRYEGLSSSLWTPKRAVQATRCSSDEHLEGAQGVEKLLEAVACAAIAFVLVQVKVASQQNLVVGVMKVAVFEVVFDFETRTAT